MQSYTTNKWLDSTVSAYLTYFKPNQPVVYEVGSRDGRDGAELLKRIGGAITPESLVLIEPNPPQADLIRRTYPQATVVETAIDNHAEIQQFIQISGSEGEIGSSSLDVHTLHTKTGQKQLIWVKSRRLDDVMSELGSKHVDIMKVDTEGYSYEVLQGLGDRLTDISVLHLETEIKGLARNKTNLDVFTYMRNHGFLCYGREHEWGDGIEDQIWVNCNAYRLD